MKKRKIQLIIVTFLVTIPFISIMLNSCSSARISQIYSTDTIYSNTDGKGFTLQLDFQKGPEHNHPLMAVWITDTSDKYIETLFIAESISKGYFDRVDISTGKWLPGKIRRPAALPVWSHSRNIQEADGLYVPTPETATPDAITGATPKNNFVLIAKTSSKTPEIFTVYFEINQPWDWNEYWTNNKYPDDNEYKTSCQPALVYKATIDTRTIQQNIPLQLIGRSHFNGSDGKIYTDLETITTAKEITSSLFVKLLSR
jgi:hypothetical protein